MDELERILEALRKKIEETSHSSEARSNTYECELCHDQAWITEKDENGILSARRCSCWPAREAKRLLQQSGLADVIDEKTFDSFADKTPVQKLIKETATQYVHDLLAVKDDPSKKKPWMYIGGNPGSGKTHICTAVCGELLKKGMGVKYMQWVTESKKLKLFGNDDPEEQAAEFINPQVLYIDDLLKQKYTDNPVFSEADIRVAFTILNARYLLNRPTIISSEWDLLGHLLEADEGVFSRVYERSKEYTVIVERRRTNDYRLMG